MPKYYTKEFLEETVKECYSLAEVLRKSDKKISGSQQSNLKRWIKKFDINTSHFLGQRRNKGEAHKGGSKKKTWQEVLVLKESGTREDAFRLRRALIEYGREYKCECCKSGPIWNGKELRLQVNHKDGNYLNNRPNNLEFMCPNCHSQTPNWSGYKGLTTVTAIIKIPAC